MYDLIIIGGSAAGTAAAVYASRAQLNFKVIAKDLGGEVANSGEVGNYPGFNATTGIELSQKFNDQLKFNQVKVEVGIEVEKVIRRGNGFIVQTRDGKSDEAKTIILATGVRSRLLKVPGEKEFYQKGVSYCTTCDGPLFRNKLVATIGGGNSALESILFLAGVSQKVYGINQNSEYRGERIYINKLKTLKNVELIYHADTVRIFGDQAVSGFEYKDNKTGETKTININGIFIHAGVIPNSDPVKDLGVLNEFGFIEVNSLMETKVPGFFAAGDVVNLPYKQIAISAGQGVTALLTAQTYLNRLG